MKSTYMEQTDLLSHFPNKFSNDIKDYATDVVFKTSRYIFAEKKVKGIQTCYCTHCRKSFVKESALRHNQETICPFCKSKCVVKAAGLKRTKMIDEAYFVYYGKSTINSKAIVARGIYAVRDYTGSYRSVETKYIVTAYYLFEPGNCSMLSGHGYLGSDNKVHHWGLYRSKSIHSCWSYYSNSSRMRFYCSNDSIQKAVENTLFQYSTWEQYVSHYTADDMIKFFALYAYYPCVEYLTKLGFRSLIGDKLMDRNTYSAINWRGKTLFQVLKLSKNELAEIKSQNIDVDYRFLRYYQITRKDGSGLTMKEIEKLTQKEYFYYYKDLVQLLKYGSLRKVTQYIEKQYDATRDKYHYGMHYVVSDWRDYLNDCKKLEMNLREDSVVFPRDLHQAHQNTIKQIKIKEDKEASKKILERFKSLKKYCFEYGGILIRPAKDAKELINEGKVLHHCVGTYADRHARGECAIFFIRKKSDPDTPYYTLELRQDRIIQTRGKNNCSPTLEVNEFLQAWTAEKLTSKKKSEQQIRIMVPA